MNANVFAVQAPDSVESILENASATCVKFNHGKGTFAGQNIATGRSDGFVAVWDVETRTLLRWLEGHVKAVTSVSWSHYNRYLASASLDWNVIIWDMSKGYGERTKTLRFDAPVTSVQFCPDNSKLLLVVLESQQAVLVDMRRKRRRGSAEQATNGEESSIEGATKASSTRLGDDIEERKELGINAYKQGDETPSSSHIISATFSPDGELIFGGTAKGDMLVFEGESGNFLQRIDVSGSSGVREIAFDRTGRSLVTNSNDRAVRLFSVIQVDMEFPTQIEVRLIHRFQDLVNRTPWLGIGFSGDGEYIFGGAAHKQAHNIYIWDQGARALDKVLQGPRDSLIAVDWHPNKPMLASVSNTGTVNIWFTPPTEIWSAYAPGFEELEENVEYEEREDEFDLEDEDAVTRRKQDEEEAKVDIVGVRVDLLHQDSSKVKAGAKEKSKSSGHALGQAEGEEAEEVELFPDDDLDRDFFLPVRLSLELPDLEEED